MSTAPGVVYFVFADILTSEGSFFTMLMHTTLTAGQLYDDIVPLFPDCSAGSSGCHRVSGIRQKLSVNFEMKFFERGRHWRSRQSRKGATFAGTSRATPY